MRTFPIVSAAWVALFLGTACGKSEETPPPQTPPPSPYQQNPQGYGNAPPQGYGNAPPQGYGNAPPQGYGNAPPQGYGGAGGSAPPPGQPGQMQPLGAVLADPQTLQTILAGALSGGAAALGGLTGGEQGPIEQGIKMQAQTQAKGAHPEGQLLTGRLSPDGHAEGSLTMQPGACYTVIGFGGPGVFDYQLNLVTAPPVPPQVLAQSPAGGVAPVVGPNDQCIRSPYPLPMVVKIDMHLLKGQGLVGAQVYRK
ncbi:MAG TPA: hypothetical protein VHE30_16870 [Polyangiaceae bacterium]|nr:hypothetical protein [Polyangiaceae bacterium]